MLEHDGKFWITVDEAQRFEGITRREVYRRLKPADPDYLISRDRRELDGQPGRLIDPLRMTFNAQVRWREELLKQSAVGSRQPAANGQTTPQGPDCAILSPQTTRNTSSTNPSAAAQVQERESEIRSGKSEEIQPTLWPQTELDRKIAALDVHELQKSVILGRFRAIRSLVNHDYKAQGYSSKEAYIHETAPQCRVSRNTLWRWYNQYMERQDLRDLANEAPGPAATGIGSKALDVVIDQDDQAISARAFIKDRWIAGDLKHQIYGKLITYLTEKQRGCGVAYAYRFPSESTVSRFIDCMDPLVDALRQDAEAVKAACGYIDRGYQDLLSLEVVEADECQLNILSYDPRHWDKIVRFWVVTLYDERSMYPVAWDVVGGKDGAAKAHGITHEDERRLFERLVREYGVPGCIHSDRGRFRGNFWGHEPGKKRDAQFAANDGIFEALGVARNLPREKNPRGTRLERFHRFLADKARPLNGWIGANTEERKISRGDADAAEHLRRVAGEQATTPLLSKQQIVEHVIAWMEEWRGHSSSGTDMNGLSPRAVFIEQTPVGGFRQIAEAELALITAEYFTARKILEGGIIQLSDGKRYGLPGELTLIAGEKRDVTRSRDDHSFVKVLPLQKGQATLIAHRRARVGHDDPDALGREMEMQRKLRNLAVAIHAPAPASREEPFDPKHPEISSVEFLMSRKGAHREAKAAMFNDDAAAAVLAAMKEEEDAR